MKKYSEKMLALNKEYPWKDVADGDTIEARQKFFFDKEQ